MANMILGRAIASGVAKASKKSKGYKIKPDGTVIFRMHTIVGIYGFIGTLGTAACAFIPDIAAMLLMMAMIGPLFVPFFLYYLFARLYINDKMIVYRNPLGRRRQIAWKDLNAAVSVGIFGDHMLYGSGEAIRLYPYFSGFSVVLEMLHQYRPEAFDPECALAHATEFQQAGSRGHTFRWFKAFRTVGLIIMLYGLAFLLLPNRMFVPAIGSQFMGKFFVALIFVVCGLPFFLLYINMRLYIDDEKIVYTNIFRVTKQVRWEDVSSYRSYRIDKGGFYRGCIRIFHGDKKVITISSGFCGHNMIEHLVTEIGKRRRIRFW